MLRLMGAGAMQRYTERDPVFTARRRRGNRRRRTAPCLARVALLFALLLVACAQPAAAQEAPGPRSQFCDAPATLSVTPPPGSQEQQDEYLKRFARDALACTQEGRDLIGVLDSSGYTFDLVDARKLEAKYGRGTNGYVDHETKKIEVSRELMRRPKVGAVYLGHELVHVRDAEATFAAIEAYRAAHDRTRQKGIERVISFLNPFNNKKKPELPEKRALRETLIESEVQAYTVERAIAKQLRQQCAEFEGIEPEGYGFCAPLTREQWIEVLRRDPHYGKLFDPKVKFDGGQRSTGAGGDVDPPADASLPPATAGAATPAERTPQIQVDWPAAAETSAQTTTDQGATTDVSALAPTSDAPPAPSAEQRRAADDTADAAREAQQLLDRDAQAEEQRIREAQELAARDELLRAQQAEFDAAVAAGLERQPEPDPTPPQPLTTEPATPPVRQPEEPEPEPADESGGDEGTDEPVTPPWTPPAGDGGGSPSDSEGVEPVEFEPTPQPVVETPSQPPPPPAEVLPDCAPDLSYLTHCGGNGAPYEGRPE